MLIKTTKSHIDAARDTDKAKGVENLKLQREFFASETKKQKNKKLMAWHEIMDHSICSAKANV